MELTVASDRLILTTLCPEARANAITRLVLPTPGLPSSKRALLGSWRARSRRQRLVAGVLAARLNGSGACVLSRHAGETTGPSDGRERANR